MPLYPVSNENKVIPIYHDAKYAHRYGETGSLTTVIGRVT